MISQMMKHFLSSIRFISAYANAQSSFLNYLVQGRSDVDLLPGWSSFCLVPIQSEKADNDSSLSELLGRGVIQTFPSR